MDIATLVLALLLVLLAVAAAYALRWVFMRRHGGVSVALRWQPDREKSGWHLGVGRYRGEEFVWYRVWSLRIGPSRVFYRDTLHIVTRRDPVGTESYAVPPGSRVLRCRPGDDEPIEIAMGPGALTGFLSWLESAPPGRKLPRAS
ncbi:DUF2550 domain-containing protein [Saccharomonospora sp. NB11]|jgi:hypothetical protein|uniref:DUF2550 domain-containing protein n=1 Tax=Saccharomonospora sp. NB11 TaxID=1642298 RepID=UPI0018D08E59|nr:DUF2550 domain-containing protein [Saccharomonospora sp. NB11]